MTEYVVYAPYYGSSAETIMMNHEGRYITLQKESEKDKRYYRYDLANGSFERINFYKTVDTKINAVDVRNITSWFKDCQIVTDDPKFARLYYYARSEYRNRYSSPVRFIEAFATKRVAYLEQWLALGVRFDHVEEMFEKRRASYKSYSKVRYAPKDFNKELLDFVIDKSNKSEKGISYRELNELYEQYNNGEYHILQQVKEVVDRHPEYYRLFNIQRNVWDTDFYDFLEDKVFLSSRDKMLKTIIKYNLDIESFLSYLYYLSNVEGLTVEELLADYPDYLEREYYLKAGTMSKMEKYPKLFLSTSWKQEKEFRSLKRLQRLEDVHNIQDDRHDDDFNNNINDNKHLEYKKGKYLIRMPLGAHDIKDEAAQMHHCVASYIERIEAGQTIVMFMREKKQPEQSLVTVEVHDNKVVQARGNRNRDPTLQQIIWLQKWAEKKKLEIACSNLM